MNNRLIPDVLDQGAINDLKNDLGLEFTFSEMAFGIFGFVLVLMMVLRPEGILPERRRQIELTEPADEKVRIRGARMSTDAQAAAPAAEPSSEGALLATDRVSKAFGGLVAVSDVSIAVAPRSIVSIIGPNGAGKTTFFNMLTGLYKPTAGRITFDGKDVTGDVRTSSPRWGSRGRSRTSVCSPP